MESFWSDMQVGTPTAIHMELWPPCFSRSALGRKFASYVLQHVQVSSTRFRVPDVCVVLTSDPAEPIVRHAPFLRVEVICRIDTVPRLNEKLPDYFQMGVRYVWVLDPLTRRAFGYTPGEMRELLDGMLRPNNPDIVVPLEEVFEA